MQDLASLFPVFLALAATAAATLGPGALRRSSGRSGAFLLRYIALMVPATATALALIHLHDDYGVHGSLCVPLALLGAMAVLAVSFLAGFVAQQWRVLGHLAAWSGEVPSSLLHTVTALAARLGISPPPLFLVEVDRPVALTVGVFRPRIYLSGWYLDSLTPAELEGVLAHELAHVARRDNLFALLGTVFLGATAYLPASWQAVEALLAERELAADALAVAVTGKPIALARGLIKANASTPLHFGPVASGHGSSVQARLENLLRLSRGSVPDVEGLRNEPRRLLIAMLVAPVALGWLIFNLPHLLLMH